MTWRFTEPPRDRTVFLTYFGDVPVFASWCDSFEECRYVLKGRWPFRREVYETSRSKTGGFRVVSWVAREREWAIKAQFAPFTPRFWQPILNQPRDKR